jgi:hypothetical protein
VEFGLFVPASSPAHHQGRLGISGNADIAGGLTFTDETGRIITASGSNRNSRVAHRRPSPVSSSIPRTTAGHELGDDQPSHYGHRRAERWRNRATIAQP